MSQNFWAVEYALVADLLIRIARQPRHSKSDRKSVKRPIKTDGPNGKPWACKGRFPASGSPGNDRFFLKANTAIPRVMANRWEDRLKPNLPSGETLSNLKPFPAK
jgi:hypothetical protein